MKKTKLFFDTEFTGLHKGTTLISIGIVSNCGKTFYAELNDYDESQVNDWIRDNVIKNLLFAPPLDGQDEHYMTSRSATNDTPNNIYLGYDLQTRCNTKSLKSDLTAWISQFSTEEGSIEIIADVNHYDWVLFCDIFGGAFDVPKSIYYIPLDLATFMWARGLDNDFDREELIENLIGNVRLPFTNKYPEQMDDIPKHNSLWDAYVTKACFEKVSNMTYDSEGEEWLFEPLSVDELK